ncbi:MAG: DUF7003 family protein [Terriglobales bacterium]
MDKHAAEFNFPALNNPCLEVADARLTAFRGRDQWVLFFEVVGFSSREIAFVDHVYAYGSSCVYPEGVKGERIVLTAVPGKPLFDPETNDCIADWARWSVLIEGREYEYAPSLAEYARAGLDISTPRGISSIREIEILRFLIHDLGHLFFATDDELLRLTPECRNSARFLQVTEWQHPDVISGERPSDSPGVSSVIHAIAAGDASLFDPGRPNTHWKYWLQSQQRD